MKVCTVCGHAVKDNATVTQCGHLFHEMCLTIWFESFSTCPTCSVPVREFIPVVSSDDERTGALRNQPRSGSLHRRAGGGRGGGAPPGGSRTAKGDTLRRPRRKTPGRGNAGGAPHPMGTTDRGSYGVTPDLLSISVGELLTTGGYGTKILELEREVSKLKLDLRFERKCRRWLEHDVEELKREKGNLEHVIRDQRRGTSQKQGLGDGVKYETSDIGSSEVGEGKAGKCGAGVKVTGRTVKDKPKRSLSCTFTGKRRSSIPK